MPPISSPITATIRSRITHQSRWGFPRMHGNSAGMSYDVSEMRGNMGKRRGNVPRKRGNVFKIMMWDVGGDDFGTLKDTWFLEFASLSLDESEVEIVFFSEDT
ncbi:hypothetical protein Tco_0144955 [Tanacetum coccineum]